MIAYLINFTLCSALLLLAYQLLLKNKAMYGFNRLYLLVSILFSMTVPLIVVNHTIAPLPSIQPAQVLLPTENVIIRESHGETPLIVPGHTNYLLYSCLAIYSIVTLLLLIRLIRNLYAIRLTLLNNETTNYKNARLVLIDESLTPHTFLKYIFLNKHEYQQRQIENDVLQHELTHARQLHSADIILVEIVQAFCWFNPLLILYRKAIQLNHEFIADAAVLDAHHNLNAYQHLLISKAAQFKSLYITSQFNYSITKKRLIMMTKTTSAITAWFTRLAIIPFIAAAFMLFCSKTEAKQGDNSIKHISAIEQPDTPAVKQRKRDPMFISMRTYPSTKAGISETLMNEYKTIEAKYLSDNPKPNKVIPKITDADKTRLEELFKQMSHEQQQLQGIGFMYPPKPIPPSKPTQKQLDKWKSSIDYGVWIDDKRVKNTELENYKPEDFLMAFKSNLTQIAINNDKFRYQITLMTTAYYKTYRKKALDERNKSMIYYRRYKSV